MTVKIGMGGSALDLKDAQVQGNPVQKIMVGLGNTAMLAWQRINPLVPWWSQTESSVELPEDEWTTVQQNTVVGEGLAHIHCGWRYDSTSLFFSYHWRRIRVLVNGVQVGFWEHRNQATDWESTGVIENFYLNDGDFIELQGFAEVSNAYLRTLTYNWLQYTPV